MVVAMRKVVIMVEFYLVFGCVSRGREEEN
jgi:hypothetical protein